MICDFGLGTKSSHLVKKLVLTRCGSPGYVAPEILIQKPDDPNFQVEPSCDVFSMGIIYYILLTGCSPWDTKNEVITIQQNKEAKVDYSNKDLRN